MESNKDNIKNNTNLNNLISSQDSFDKDSSKFFYDTKNFSNY